jgi:hypothetical protein
MVVIYFLNETNELAALLHSSFDPTYSSDGQMLVFMYCCIHIYHVASVESIKDKIRKTILAEHQDDMQAYLRFLQKKYLIMPTSSTDTDHKLPHIYLQLHLTKIPIFQQIVLQWHHEFLENSLKITPTEFMRKEDDECQILKHSDHWVETIDPSIIAM